MSNLNTWIEGDAHSLEFTPNCMEWPKKYSIIGREDGEPIVFKTATAGMKTYVDPVLEYQYIEHLRLDGKIDFIKLYKDKELLPMYGNTFDNFINLGWKYKNGREYLKIDIYTGEFLHIKELN